MDIRDVKRNLNRIVNYNGKSDVYMLTGCTLRREINDGDFWYQVELTDVIARSLVYDYLDKIKGAC